MVNTMKLKKPACHNCKHSKWHNYKFKCKLDDYKVVDTFYKCGKYEVIIKTGYLVK
jgi:hypothetical protein